MAINKEFVSQLQLDVSPLLESDIEQFDPILTAHVRNSTTGEVIAEMCIRDSSSGVSRWELGATHES